MSIRKIFNNGKDTRIQGEIYPNNGDLSYSDLIEKAKVIKYIYLNPFDGNDSKNGKSKEEAVKTIGKAVELFNTLGGYDEGVAIDVIKGSPSDYDGSETDYFYAYFPDENINTLSKGLRIISSTGKYLNIYLRNKEASSSDFRTTSVTGSVWVESKNDALLYIFGSVSGDITIISNRQSYLQTHKYYEDNKSYYGSLSVGGSVLIKGSTNVNVGSFYCSGDFICLDNQIGNSSATSYIYFYDNSNVHGDFYVENKKDGVYINTCESDTYIQKSLQIDKSFTIISKGYVGLNATHLVMTDSNSSVYIESISGSLSSTSSNGSAFTAVFTSSYGNTKFICHTNSDMYFNNNPVIVDAKYVELISDTGFTFIPQIISTSSSTSSWTTLKVKSKQVQGNGTFKLYRAYIESDEYINFGNDGTTWFCYDRLYAKARECYSGNITMFFQSYNGQFVGDFNSYGFSMSNATIFTDNFYVKTYGRRNNNCQIADIYNAVNDLQNIDTTHLSTDTGTYYFDVTDSYVNIYGLDANSSSTVIIDAKCSMEGQQRSITFGGYDSDQSKKLCAGSVLIRAESYYVYFNTGLLVRINYSYKELCASHSSSNSVAVYMTDSSRCFEIEAYREINFSNDNSQLALNNYGKLILKAGTYINAPSAIYADYIYIESNGIGGNGSCNFYAIYPSCSFNSGNPVYSSLSNCNGEVSIKFCGYLYFNWNTITHPNSKLVIDGGKSGTISYVQSNMEVASAYIKCKAIDFGSGPQLLRASEVDIDVDYYNMQHKNACIEITNITPNYSYSNYNYNNDTRSIVKVGIFSTTVSSTRVAYGYGLVRFDLVQVEGSEDPSDDIIAARKDLDIQIGCLVSKEEYIGGVINPQVIACESSPDEHGEFTLKLSGQVTGRIDSFNYKGRMSPWLHDRFIGNSNGGLKKLNDNALLNIKLGDDTKPFDYWLDANCGNDLYDGQQRGKAVKTVARLIECINRTSSTNSCLSLHIVSGSNGYYLGYPNSLETTAPPSQELQNSAYDFSSMSKCYYMEIIPEEPFLNLTIKGLNAGMFRCVGAGSLYLLDCKIDNCEIKSNNFYGYCSTQPDDSTTTYGNVWDIKCCDRGVLCNIKVGCLFFTCDNDAYIGYVYLMYNNVIKCENLSSVDGRPNFYKIQYNTVLEFNECNSLSSLYGTHGVLTINAKHYVSNLALFLSSASQFGEGGGYNITINAGEYIQFDSGNYNLYNTCGTWQLNAGKYIGFSGGQAFYACDMSITAPTLQGTFTAFGGSPYGNPSPSTINITANKISMTRFAVYAVDLNLDANRFVGDIEIMNGGPYNASTITHINVNHFTASSYAIVVSSFNPAATVTLFANVGYLEGTSTGLFFLLPLGSAQVNVFHAFGIVGKYFGSGNEDTSSSNWANNFDVDVTYLNNNSDYKYLSAYDAGTTFDAYIQNNSYTIIDQIPSTLSRVNILLKRNNSMTGNAKVELAIPTTGPSELNSVEVKTNNGVTIPYHKKADGTGGTPPQFFAGRRYIIDITRYYWYVEDDYITY